MPPKKEEVPPPPPTDNNVYGAFMRVSVPEARLQLGPQADGIAVRAYLSLNYSSEFAAMQGEHVPIQEDGMALVAFSRAFRAEATMAGLQHLLNASITLSVHDAASGVQLAWAALDMLPLARGAQAFSMTNLQLTCCEPSAKNAVQVQSGALPLVSVSLAIRRPPEGAEAGAAAPSPEELPEPEPWFYVSPQDAASANVIELLVTGMDPAPAGLLSAAATAREGKAPGKMTLLLGLGLPGGAPTLVSSALPLPPAPQPGQDSASAAGALGGQAVRVRQYLTGDQAKQLLFALEDGSRLHLEVARYLQHDSLQDPRWEHYHAAVELQGVQQLADIGCTAYQSQGPLHVRSFASADGLTTVLPAYAPTNAKGKPIEDANAAEPNGAWEAAGATVSVALSLAAPLAPSWTPPPPPPQPLASVLALRPRPDLAKRRTQAAVPPTPATDTYRQLIAELGASLKALAMDGSSAGDQVIGAKTLVAELKASGRYTAMTRALGAAAAAIVKERYRMARDAGVVGGPTEPDAGATAVLREDLHALLAEQLAATAAPGSAEALRAKPSALPGADAATSGGVQEAARLLALAHQCEEAGQVARAESLHQRRVLLATAEGTADPAAAVAAADAWREYGAFCMRQGQQGRGEECFRQGLSASAVASVGGALAAVEEESELVTGIMDSPVDAAAASAASVAANQCRLALAACLVHQGRVTDAMFLKEAESVVSDVLAAAGVILSEASAAHFSNAGNHAFAPELSMASVATSVAGPAGSVTAGPAGLSSAGPGSVAAPPSLGALSALEGSDRQDVAMLRTLLLQASGDSRGPAAAVAAQQLVAVEAADTAAATGVTSTSGALDPSTVVNPCLLSASRLLRLGLPSLALSALDLARQLPLSGAALDPQVSLMQAEALNMLGDEESRAQALDLLQGLCSQHKAPSLLAEAFELKGHLHFKAANHHDAVLAYQDSLAVHGVPSRSSRLYLQLAKSYEALGLPDYALTVYTQACSAVPSSRAWLGVSTCHTMMGELAAASLALSEAAALDPEDPEVWGRAGLLALKSGRMDEAANALKCAVRLARQGVFSALTPSLMEELASEYSKTLSLDLPTGAGGQGVFKQMELQTILWALNSAESSSVKGIYSPA